MTGERRWRCGRHGVVEPLPPDAQGVLECPVEGCGWVVIAPRLDHPELDADEPDYFVFRGGTSTDGVWVDRRVLGTNELGGASDPSGRVLPRAPNGEFETREDGAIAEIRRPVDSG